MSNPVQINMYGIRYFIDGDLSDPHVKKLMVQARNDLQQMKGRNINNIPHIWLNKPNAYKIVSQFGIDSAYINVPKKEEKKYKKISYEIERPLKKINIEYIPVIEAYDVDRNLIGYVLGESGTFEPPYVFLKTENVIMPSLNGEEAATVKAANPKITVDPFYWPCWKYFEDVRPFTEVELQDKEVYRTKSMSDDREEEVVYTDIACTFENFIIPPDSWSALVVEDYQVTWNTILNYMYQCATQFFHWFYAATVGTIWTAFSGHNEKVAPSQTPFLTTDLWDHVAWDYPELPEQGAAHGLVPLDTYEIVGQDWRSVFSGNHLVDPDGAEGICIDFYNDYVSPLPEDGAEWTTVEACWAERATFIADRYESTDWDDALKAYLGPQYNKMPTAIQRLHEGAWVADVYNWKDTFNSFDIANGDFWSSAKDVNNYAWCVQSYGQDDGYSVFRKVLAAEEFHPGHAAFPPNETMYCMPCLALIDSAWVHSEELPTETVNNYFYNLYIEVVGKYGLERFSIREEYNQDVAYWSKNQVSDANVRYYKISEGLYFVAAAVEEYVWENRALDNIKYCFFRSGAIDAERFVATEMGVGNIGYPYGGWPLRYHVIPDILTPEGNKIYGSGEFRLFRRTTTTKRKGVKEKFESTVEI